MTHRIISHFVRLMTGLLRHPGQLKNLRFSRPAKATIALYDGHSYHAIKHLLFEGREIGIIYVRGEQLCVHPAIVFATLKNLPLLQFRFLPAYTLALLRHIQPRIIVTYIDNSNVLEALFDHYQARYFYIQNGKRDLWELEELRCLGTFFCFGPRDIDMYRKKGIQVEQYVPCGPLLMGHYLSEHLGQAKPTIKYDLCLISQYRANHFNQAVLSDYIQRIKMLYEFSAQFLRQQKQLKLAVALVRMHGEASEELNFYREQFADIEVFYQQEPGAYANYNLLMESEVVLSFDSTLGVESFASGKKTFLFDYLEHERNETPGFHSPIFSMAGPNYDEFQRKVQALLAMPHGDYLNETKADREYWASLNLQKPAHVVINQYIEAALIKSSES